MEKIDNKFAGDLARLVKSEFHAQEVIIFGSYAKGLASYDSDLDILVIMDTKLKPYRQAAIIRMFIDAKLGVKHPIDLMVRTPQQIEQRLQMGDFFIKEVVNSGLRL